MLLYKVFAVNNSPYALDHDSLSDSEGSLR